MYQHHLTIKSTGAYAKYWASFFYILRENYDGNSINHTLIDAAIALEGDVFRRLLVAMQSPVVSPVLVQIAKIGQYTRPLESEQWLDALKKAQLQPEVSSNDKLLIGDENFFHTMAVLMSSYRETQLLSLIAWSCVQLLAPAVDLRLLRSRYDQGVILYRPYFCERFVETGYRLLVIALGSVSRFSRPERAAVSAKFDHLVTVGTGLVNATDWLDRESRQLAAEKLSSTRLQLWPPNIFLRNEELEGVYADYPSAELPFAEYWIQSSRRAAETYRTRTDIDILSYAVNYALPYLQYDAASGSVKVALGALSPPLYYPDGNKAMFYGGLGFSMAVQLVASLDRQGLRWHPDGTFGDSFLSNAADRAFEDKDGCLEAAQKGPVDVPRGYPTRTGSRASVFPEIPALEVAYAAYRLSITDSEDERRQALIRNISGDQVFFMTLCYMTCSLPGVVGPHTVDCNKAVSSSEAFARAFQCPQGSRMNPKKKEPVKRSGAFGSRLLRGRCPPRWALRLNQAAASSVLLYALPLVNLTPARRSLLEGLHRGAVRTILGLPRCSPVAATLAEAREWPLTLRMLQRALGHIRPPPPCRGRCSPSGTLAQPARIQDGRPPPIVPPDGTGSTSPCCLSAATPPAP
ncbi:hypothetical protein HPB52_000926 [Rhipicephalus sanguineus]|uniref:Uncharacterized protein n=1 Tax=Rhipicephalus sanguineus TaxID=34632 RepID=A0A9D4SVX8_RHISA|nr:hypothetical protein HPB52_000926 [Rhipicephalus sanguineus]